MINEHSIMDFVSHLQKNLNASSILFYIRALLKYLDFLFLREEVTNARHSRLSLMIGNIRSSLEKTRKQDNVLLQVEAE